MPAWRNLVDATDLKSVGYLYPCQFKSGRGHHFFWVDLLSLALQYNISDIKELLKDDLNVVNNLLQDTVNQHCKLIADIGNNIFSAGGKKIRPMLTILSGKLFNYNSKELYYLATAVELIHSATLLHDDVIDNSELRRGKHTANKTYGNKSSILVGDFLFAESFKLMVKSNSLKSLMILSDASSIISEGEVKQLELKQKKVFSKQEYLAVIEAKTAVLFGAATESATALAGRSENECKLLKEFGINLGIAFQIIDDILDYSAKENLLGKNIGNDFFEKKITLPIILLYYQSNKLAQQEITKLFNQDRLDTTHLNEVVSLLDKNNIFHQCYSYAETYINNAIKILNNFSSNKSKDILETICYIALSRKY